MKSGKCHKNEKVQVLLSIKMLTAIQIQQIRELFSHGHSIKSIARVTGVARNTVRRYLRKPAGSLDDPSTTRNSTCWLLHHQTEIKDFFLESEGICVVVQRRITQKFNRCIHVRQLQRFCRDLRKELNAVQPHSRYETQPGVQMQIDFAEKDVIVNGKTLRVHFFIAVLGYSRRIFAKAYSAENQAAWLDGIESAFFFFGGVPLALLSDNSKCLITAHRHRGGVQLTQSYRHFCQYWAVKPIASTPYYPQSKGKVERAVRYVKENALAGQKVQSLQELNAWLERWSLAYADQRCLSDFERNIKTPRDRFQIEKRYLRSIDGKPRIANVREETRKVDSAGLIRIDGDFYPLPKELSNKVVQVLVDDTTIVVTNQGALIAELDKADTVYRPEPQKVSGNTLPDLPIVAEAYAHNPIQRPLTDYSAYVGGWS